jgi:hypothetical protein
MKQRCKQQCRTLTRQEHVALHALLTFKLGINRKSHSLMEWAALIQQGKVDDDTRCSLEHIGIKIDRSGRKGIILRLANPYLLRREKELAIQYSGVRKHFNTLLRHIGGWSGGTYRFAGKPQRATCIALRPVKT